MADRVSGAATRRRQRRLRSWWRHEQQSIAAPLSHHSAQRLRTARAGEWGSEQNYTSTIRNTPLPSRSSSICRLTKSPAGRGLTGSPLVRPQDQVQRQTVDQIVDAVPGFPQLDVPVPQVMEQLPDVLRLFATRLPVVAERVIDVPKSVFSQGKKRK